MGFIPSDPEVWILLVLQGIPLLAIYFLPSLVVGIRRVRAGGTVSQVGVRGSISNLWMVPLVNLFLGWTVIGWFVALLMAFAREEAPLYTRG